jgi:hypothetical protein
MAQLHNPEGSHHNEDGVAAAAAAAACGEELCEHHWHLSSLLNIGVRESNGTFQRDFVGFPTNFVTFRTIYDFPF